MRTALIGAGAVVLLLGLLFMAQGTGAFPYPASSFMVGAPQWIGYGAMIAAAGACLILIGRRVRR